MIFMVPSREKRIWILLTSWWHLTTVDTLTFHAFLELRNLFTSYIYISPPPATVQYLHRTHWSKSWFFLRCKYCTVCFEPIPSYNAEKAHILEFNFITKNSVDISITLFLINTYNITTITFISQPFNTSFHNNYPVSTVIILLQS